MNQDLAGSNSVPSFVPPGVMPTASVAPPQVTPNTFCIRPGWTHHSWCCPTESVPTAEFCHLLTGRLAQAPLGRCTPTSTSPTRQLSLCHLLFVLTCCISICLCFRSAYHPLTFLAAKRDGKKRRLLGRSGEHSVFSMLLRHTN